MEKVLIEYLLVGQTNWSRKEITLSEFFENFSEKDSIFDAIEIYYLEPEIYIDQAASKIMFLNFTIVDKYNNKIITKYTYWNNGLSQIKDYCEYTDGQLNYSTIICSVNIDDESTNLLLRLEGIKGQLVPLTHSVGNLEGTNNKQFDLSAFEDLRQGGNG